MKALKLSLVIMAAALLTIGLSSTAYAFHNGGVAHCNGCHSMHNSAGGAPMTKAGGVAAGTVGTGNAYLLIGATQSDTCLECHASSSATPSSFHVATIPLVTPLVQLSPGGDFSWLQYPLAQAASVKDPRGHNIIAPAYGFNAESTAAGTTAPGGGTTGYDRTKLHCTSCHDPHGKYRITDPTNAYTQVTSGAPIIRSSSTPTDIAAFVSGNALGTYRLLAGQNYAPVSYPSVPFANKAPVAVAPNTYNRSEATTDTRVAYGMGMSEWCANCHGAFHGTASGSPGSELTHPSGAGALLTSAVVNNYNHYVSTGNFTGTSTRVGFPYNSLVPFEEGVQNLTNLSLDAVSTGVGATTTIASTSHNVMCLTCHRAHASGFSHMTRWDITQTFLVDGTGAYSIPSGSGYAAADVQKAYYDRAPGGTIATGALFPPFQRSLCNKCHAQD
jgi:hypothetical protein